MDQKPTYEELEKRVQELESAESERKRVSKALQDSETRLRLLYERAPLGYQSLDENGCFIEVNKAWLDTLGYSREEVIGKSFGDFLHPDWADHFKENFPRFKAVGEILGVEFEMVRKDGTIILVSFNGKIGKDSNGRFQQTHCILHDITDTRRAEEKIKIQAQIAANMAEGVTMARLRDGIIIYTNPKFEEMFGYAPGEMLWRHISILGPLLAKTPEETAEEIMAVLREEKKWSGEIQNIKKDRSVFWSNVNVSAFEHPEEGLVVVAVHTDITDRVQAEEALRKSQEQLRQAHRLARIGVWNWIASTDTVTWSEELYHIAGLDPKIPAPTYSEHRNIYAPESWARLEEAVQRALETGASYQLGLELIRPDGTSRWVNAFGGVIYGDHGRVTGLHGTVQDITERKRAEEALRNTLQRFYLMLANMYFGVLLMTEEGRVEFVNQAFCDAYGLKESLTDLSGGGFVRPARQNPACLHRSSGGRCPYPGNP